jgi:hypothetical protein
MNSPASKGFRRGGCCDDGQEIRWRISMDCGRAIKRHIRPEIRGTDRPLDHPWRRDFLQAARHLGGQAFGQKRPNWLVSDEKSLLRKNKN